MVGSVAVLVGVVVIMSGCVMRPGGIAASTVPINGRSYVNLGPVASTSSRIHLFGVLPVSGGNTIRAAVAAATKSKQGDAMIGVTVETYTQFWFVFMRYVTSVHGEAIRFQ
jgi:hypothetical protein